jgi:hypothetical protein
MAPPYRAAAMATLLFCGLAAPVAAAAHKQPISSYVVPKERTTGRLPGSRALHLAIGLQPRERAGLAKLAADVNDPKSSQFRHFQTLQQLKERFSPTETDYQEVIDWAKANQLKVDQQFGHRLLLIVSGNASDVERALAVTLHTARRTDGSEFYKPDRKPSLDLDVAVSHVAGIDNLFVPKHHGGSLLGGSAYGSHDLRHAFAANCQGLTGTGESVGITAFGGYNHADVAAYEAANGLPDSTAAGCGTGTTTSAPCLNDVLIGGFNGAINNFSDEATADVELVIAMAPGLHQVTVFEADPNLGGCTGGDAIVSQMVNTPGIKQFSTSNGICTGDNLVNLDMMAAMGETFFASSGDDGGALTLDNNNFYGIGAGKLIDVGGTVLTMNGAGVSYASEQAWKSSGGGIEVYTSFPVTCPASCTPGTSGCSGNCIPTWQHSLSGASGASSQYRNDPDVAMPALNLFVQLAAGPRSFCGTSASAPLWAGFMALVNQQRCINNPANCSRGAGFIDPLIYDIGRNPITYASSFHDVIGNSSDASCPTGGQSLNAVAGYDLATGWGSPMCGLVAQLACTFCSGATASPGTAPSANCVSFQSDASNCGSCGHICTGNLVCSGGQCVPPGSLGDTHITTLDGLYYDFQASGDFLLITTNPSFIVQTRQVSGAPSWPDASVNHAVAMKMGSNRIALFLDPARLVVEGRTVELGDAGSLALQSGVTISRDANIYTVRSLAGETVRVTVYDSWMNVAVGLGYAPRGSARGLLGDGNGQSGDDILTLDGKALAQPVSFGDLYHVYGESLRIAPRDSLFGEEKGSEPAAPARPFYANDLDTAHYQPARAACVAAGIKIDALLDSCALDVAVLGSPKAAEAFAGAPTPKAVLQPGQHPRRPFGCGGCAAASTGESIFIPLLFAALLATRIARFRMRAR